MPLYFDMAELGKPRFKVGDLYISFDPTSPAELYGGSWTQITGKFLRMANDTSGGGSDTVTLNANQMPSHLHGFNSNQRLTTWGGLDNGDRYFSEPSNYWGTYAYVKSGSDYGHTYNKISANTNLSARTTNTGGNGSHTNMPAYQDVYAWRKIA